jgi:hypothetical protein
MVQAGADAVEHRRHMLAHAGRVRATARDGSYGATGKGRGDASPTDFAFCYRDILCSASALARNFHTLLIKSNPPPRPRGGALPPGKSGNGLLVLSAEVFCAKCGQECPKVYQHFWRTYEAVFSA